MRLHPIALLTSLALDSPALAQTPEAPVLVVTGGIALEFSDGEYGRGTGPSLSTGAYIEAEISGFYLGVSGEMTDERTDNEVDYYLGYRRDLDTGFSWDVGYTRYTYPRDGGDCCGEVTLGLFTSVGDKVGLGLDLAYDPASDLGNAYLSAEYDLDDNWTLSANYGACEVDAEPMVREWDFGAGYVLSDELALDMRWYDSDGYDGYAAVSVSFDTTLFGN